MRSEATVRPLSAPLAGALIAALLAPATVNAAAWHRLSTTADRSVDIELTGMHRHGDVVLTWVRFSFVAVSTRSECKGIPFDAAAMSLPMRSGAPRANAIPGIQ
jgi:hypothetical protein